MGKDWAGPFFPPSLIFLSSIDRFVFWFMLLFHSILTFMKDLYQSENQVFNPTRLLVLLHCWVGKDWAGPFFPPSKIFWSFYWSVSLSAYVTLSLYLNTYEWPIPKRESSFQTKHFFVLLHCGVGKDWAGPFFPPPPPPKCSDLSIYFSVFQFMLFFYCIWRLMNDSFQRDNQIFKPKSLLVISLQSVPTFVFYLSELILPNSGVGKDWSEFPLTHSNNSFELRTYSFVFWIGYPFIIKSFYTLCTFVLCWGW